MDIHEWFSYHFEDLKKAVQQMEEANKKAEESEDVISDEPSEWEIFRDFLQRLFIQHDSYRGYFIEALLGFDSELEPFHEKIKTVFYNLSHDDESSLKLLKYEYNNDHVTIEYDKGIEDEN